MSKHNFYFNKKHYLCSAFQENDGVMLEWLKRHAWKACNRHKRFPSSNLGHSARKIKAGFQIWNPAFLLYVD